MLVAFLFFVCLTVGVVSQGYPSQLVLLGSDQDPILMMRWRLNETDVAIELQAKTMGWMAFGRSPNGQMDKSDILFAWVDPNGASYAQVTTAGHFSSILSTNKTKKGSFWTFCKY
jgi:hypothetical protein